MGGEARGRMKAKFDCRKCPIGVSFKMTIEYDQRKNERNFAVHGLPLALAGLIFMGPYIETIDDRADYGEVRWNVLGVIKERVLHCTYTWRGEVRRVISLRMANSRERSRYHEKINEC